MGILISKLGDNGGNVYNFKYINKTHNELDSLAIVKSKLVNVKNEIMWKPPKFKNKDCATYRISTSFHDLLIDKNSEKIIQPEEFNYDWPLILQYSSLIISLNNAEIVSK